MCDEKYSNCLNTFAFDLFRILCKDLKQNEVFSPFSVLTALNMTLLGAKNNTEKEMLDGLRYSLGFSNSDEVHAFFRKVVGGWSASEFILDVANRVLVHKNENFSVNLDYLKQLNEVYNAQVDEVNFITDTDAALKTCNDWVNNATKGKIPSILEMLQKSTRAVLLNAIYFNGTWEKPFDKMKTDMLPFFNFGEKENAKIVPLMIMNNAKAKLYSTKIDGEELEMLELPYKGYIAMNILLPKSLNGLQKITADLTSDVISRMVFICGEVDKLWLPKFKIETKYQLVEHLRLLGINDAFSATADFSGIRDDKDIFISEVIHKAAIEVNEEGTVAAAATAVVMLCGCAFQPIKKIVEFRVDHPFAYFIKDIKSGVILFAGMVNEL